MKEQGRKYNSVIRSQNQSKLKSDHSAKGLKQVKVYSIKQAKEHLKIISKP